MTQSLMSIDYTKSFGVKPQIGHHFDSKFDWIILNSMKLPRRSFGL
jgi:hypothetical protein